MDKCELKNLVSKREIILMSRDLNTWRAHLVKGIILGSHWIKTHVCWSVRGKNKHVNTGQVHMKLQPPKRAYFLKGIRSIF